MAPFDAKEFDHCKVIDPKLDARDKPSANPLVECIHCVSRFNAGVYRIRGHLLGISNGGGGKCTQAPQDAKDFFQAIENENAATASKKRTRDDLDMLTSHRGSATDGSGPSTAGSTAPAQMGIKHATLAVGPQPKHTPQPALQFSQVSQSGPRALREDLRVDCV